MAPSPKATWTVAMKKLLLAASITALSATAIAEHKVPANYGYLGLHLTEHFFDITDHGVNVDLDAGLLPGAQFGIRFKNQCSVQVCYRCWRLQLHSLFYFSSSPLPRQRISGL